MPRSYKRKTERASNSLDDLKRATEEVGQGRSIRSVAKQFKIDRTTLKRFIQKRKDGESACAGYARLSTLHMVFDATMELELACHIEKLSNQFHGLSPLKCRELAYEYARQNGVKMPESWSRDERAGGDWLQSFMDRHHMSCRTPQATSLGRAAAFNQHTVGELFNHLASVMDSASVEMKRNETSVSRQSISKEDSVKEEQMEVACDQGHAGLHGDAIKSYVEDENEMRGRNGEVEARTLNNFACSPVNVLFAEAVGQEQMVRWSALEKGEFQVHPGGEGSPGKGETAVHTLASRPVSGLIASDVTELGSVCIIEDLCLGTPIKKECFNEMEVVGRASDMMNDPMSSTGCGIPSPEDLISNSKTQQPSHAPVRIDCSRPAPAGDRLASPHGLSDFEMLRVRLLSGKTSGTLQGSHDCKLCERSFSQLETLRLHQLLHRLDGVCGCTVCGRSLETGCPSGPDRYQCDDCGKNFAHPKSLSRHQRVHQEGAMCADG